MCDIKKSSFQFYRIVFNLMALYCGYIIWLEEVWPQTLVFLKMTCNIVSIKY